MGSVIPAQAAEFLCRSQRLVQRVEPGCRTKFRASSKKLRLCGRSYLLMESRAVVQGGNDLRRESRTGAGIRNRRPMQ